MVNFKLALAIQYWKAYQPDCKIIFIMAYVVEKSLEHYVFFMDVTPKWWINHRNSQDKIIKYVIEKFSRDYYPRVIIKSRNKIDLDDKQNFLGRYITSQIENSEFTFEFFPEEEKRYISHTIRNGTIAFEQNLRRQGSRLRILVKTPSDY
jgi:hypothetical protein